ncbi:MAG: hypothetical protein ACQEV7_07850 [Bacillota bacterium]
MATYLYTDGVDDYLKTPSLTFTEVIMDYKPKALNSGALQYTVDCRELGSGYLYSSGDTGNESFGGWTTVYKNGIQVTSGANFVLPDERMTLRFLSTLQTTPVTFFTRFTLMQYKRVELFDIKFYNGTTLIAHYDMTTGTVQDQSGNGRHATLTGGTWLDDGTGGDTGTDVSTPFALSQMLYADRLADFATAQQLYKDIVQNNALKAILYADRTVNYATLQEFFQEGMERSTSFAVKVQLYKDVQQAHPLTQGLYRAIQDHADLKQIMYAEPQFNAPLRQVISRQLTQNVATLQRMYSDKQTDYPLLIQMLSDYRVYNQIIEREMLICRSFSQNLAIKRTLEKDMQI